MTFKARAPREEHEEAEGRVRDVPRPNFVLYHNPREWQITPDGDLRPSLSHVSKAPGAGADPQGSFAPVRAARLANGEVEIPVDVLGPGTHYVAEYTSHRGKGVHRTIFQEPYEGEGATRWRADPEAIAKFCLYLMRIGLIRQPQPQYVRAQIVRISRLRENHLRKRPADRGTRYESWEERLRTYDLQLKRLQEEHLPKSEDAWGAQPSPSRAMLTRALEIMGAADSAEAPSAPTKARRRGGAGLQARPPELDGAPPPSPPPPAGPDAP